MSSAKQFLESQLDLAEHLQDKLVFGSITNDGTLVLSTSKNMDIKTLKQLRNMINSQIKELKEHDATYLHEI